MQISSVTTARIEVPLKKPFSTALRSVDSVNALAVKITTDSGLFGYGEAPATAVITGDTVGSVHTAIEEFIAPSIIGRELEDFDSLMKTVQSCMVKNTSAKAAVDMALYDLFAQTANKPLWRLLGGAKPKLETDITISLGETEKMVKDSLEAVAEGYNILKVKVGKGGLDDVGRVEEIRNAVGRDITLRVDANQGWEAKQAIRIIHALEDRNLNIELVEQPVAAHDVEGLRMITQNVALPILADEAVFSVTDAIDIIRTRAADLINIKLMKTGGIYNALKICAIAEEYNIKCMMGCMLETKIAVSAAAHLAAAKNIITMIDLDGPILASCDPFTGGPEFHGPIINLSDRPGIGITAVPGLE